MTAADRARARLAYRLERAVADMAGRYGLACMDQATTTPGTDKHAAAVRRASRRFAAVQRLTIALTDIAVGDTQ